MKNTKFVTTLPNNLVSIIIGITLGDASIYRSSLTSNSRIEMSFGTNYEQFAQSIGNSFREYMSNPVKAIEIKGKNKVYINYRLKTISTPLFNVFHDMFYLYNTNTSKWTKIVPEDISNFMNPIVLAYLIMTDGNFDSGRNRVRIYTNGFTKEDVDLLATAIKEKLGIYVGVLHDRKGQYILTIGAKQLSLLRELCSPHFEKSMLYRIGM